MKVPYIDEAEVPRAKIVLYLLNPEHRAGRSKARFFSGHGYAPERWEEMVGGLADPRVGRTKLPNRKRRRWAFAWSWKDLLALGDGVVAEIRSVWFIESGERLARLATAYPLRQRKRI